MRTGIRSVLLGLILLTVDGWAETTNTFGIYLTADPVDSRITVDGTGDWSKVALQPRPIISAADIISYDRTRHAMKLRPEVFARLPKPSVNGTPFVAMAGGEKIYLGVFTTPVSSLSFAVPTILPDARMIDTNLPADTLVIQRRYPTAAFGKGEDPRDDQRIISVLWNLEKLTSSVPYVPTRHDGVKDLLWLADVGTNDVLYDLGSGDGRVVIAAVRDAHARKAVGIEIKPELVEESRDNAVRAGVSNQVAFVQGDLFNRDFSEANVVVLYLGHQPNIDLRAKIFGSLRPGSRIVSHQFSMGEWPPDKTLDVRTAMLGMYSESFNWFAKNPDVPDYDPHPFSRMNHDILSLWIVPAPVAGTWDSAVTLNGIEGVFSITLQQRLSEVSGSFVWTVNNTNISGGVSADLWGDHIRLHCIPTNRPYGKFLTWTEGKVKGDTLQGSVWVMENGETTKIPWTSQRKKGDYSGTWEWNGPTNNPVRLNIERRNGTLQATYIDGGQRVPVGDFYDHGGGFYFTLLLGSDGAGRRTGPGTGWLVGKAVASPTGDQLEGTIGFYPNPSDGFFGGPNPPNLKTNELPKKGAWHPKRVDVR